MADSATAEEAPSKPAKRSFFKKPSWATAESKSESPQTPIDVFSHSSESFAEIIAEQERRKKAKLRKKQEAQKRKENEGRENKRRRISTEAEEDRHSLSPTSSRRRSSKDRSRTPHDLTAVINSSPKSAKQHINSQSLAARHDEVAKTSNSPKKQSVVIELSDSCNSSDDDLYKPPTPIGVIVPKIQRAKEPQDEDDQEVDPEFRALAAKAREKRRLQELGATEPTGSGGPSRTSSSFSRPALAASPPAPDPIVKIFISSAIPDTVPLLVSRKLSQRLQEVRKAWCSRQNFSEDMADSVFFTYRNRRLWDVTTCKSLGIEVDSSGNIRQKDDLDLYSENDGRIHLEAVTMETWEDNKRRAGKAHTEEPEEEEQDIFEYEPAIEEPKFRLFLKARGYEDFRLQVNPTSTFESIAHAYRVSLKIPSDKSIFLMFDGDRLDPEDTMENSEIEDMDSIEVHIK
ncbi:hypothetical protein AOQ84DRAFT_440760 [Glonium stellatum]|uniref:Ubiquitin-like domain-containing protein n=1 Tax=Glonium stellatum TaxID=574774 RepID=A0A8E2EXM5_9PEZI|nr:hypothetical protein AOQ84DRAFT_440760 [Glonium stellatum]